MEDRTVTLSGLGKTYAVTGWRVGWAVAAAPLTALIRKVHDYLTICAPTPFQEAGLAALALPATLLRRDAAPYAARREILLTALRERASTFSPPEGAYYVMADAGKLGWKDDTAFVDFLARKSASSRSPARASTPAAAAGRRSASTSPRRSRRSRRRPGGCGEASLRAPLNSQRSPSRR